MKQQHHLLEQLSLPDRYETLVSKLGPDVVQLLLPPGSEVSDAFERVALAVRSRGEGVFVPVFGRSGAGKTTLISNLTHFVPASFTPTHNYAGQVTYAALVDSLDQVQRQLTANETRILPILIDHREANPPSESELAEVKRFLRSAQLAVRPIVLWPETGLETSRSMADRYIEIAGASPIPLPLQAEGPPRATWPDIASNTLRLANDMDSLEQLGIDPRNYDPQNFRTLGEFLRQLSSDFNQQVFQLRKSTRMPLTLVVVFVSESQDPGVLTQLTSSGRYGLLDAQALVAVTAGSELGKWWSERRGLLTRTIVQLNAHALHLAPGPAVSVLRNYGSDQVQKILDDVGVGKQGKARVVRDLTRADLGKFLAGDPIRAHETRGTPPDTALAAFQLLAEQGFVYGGDKSLNRSMASALADYSASRELPFNTFSCEKGLEFCGLIPDNSLASNEQVLCVEYTWRKGEFLSSGNRSTVAQYILKKLRDYARQLGWTND